MSEKSANSAPPVGSIMFWIGNDAPESEDWLLCDGRVLSATDYPELFKLSSKQWGSQSGDGVNTFNLPNHRDIYSKLGIDSKRVIIRAR
jgi:microcystin-dependent protein